MRNWIERAKARKASLGFSNSKVDEMMERPSGRFSVSTFHTPTCPPDDMRRLEDCRKLFGLFPKFCLDACWEITQSHFHQRRGRSRLTSSIPLPWGVPTVLANRHWGSGQQISNSRAVRIQAGAA